VGKCNGAKWWLLVAAYETQNYWVFGLCPTFDILNNYRTQHFGNRICFRPQVREDTYSVGSLRKSSVKFKASFDNVS
jgi:hypothetical protein